MQRLEGKVAVVTGGSRGIGFAIASRLVEAGARVVITGTNEATLARAAGRMGEGAVPVRADVRRYDEVEAAMRVAVDRLGGLDVLVNNAGIGAFEPAGSMSLDTWSAVLDTNLTGVFHCVRAALPHLKARGGGWIISISSLAGKNPFPNGAAYCASKAALNAFSEALMQEVRHDNVRVAYVLPGSVRTGFGRPGSGSESDSAHLDGDADSWKLSPDDVAQVVEDLVAHPSRSLPSRVEIRPAQPPRKG
jgi:NAD(P)-dependent dehydrogenase (short-subunit alcohol dehydrogenase family)